MNFPTDATTSPRGPEPESTRESARRLGDFELLEEIGAGGAGVVYRARQVSLDREVALKVLRGFGAVSAEDLERLRFEASSAARLQHPGIVGVHVVEQVDGVHFFVMDLIAGRSLKEWIEELREGQEAIELKRPPVFDAERTESYPRWVARLIRDIADALAAAHEAHIVHRDVKPANVMLDEKGRPHLADFGLARMLATQDPEHTTTLAGTLLYLPPEQLTSDEPVIDPRNDTYALGLMLYELLTLQHPYAGETSGEVMRAILREDRPPLRKRNPRVSRDLEAICEKAMAHDPDHRYAQAGALRDDLNRYLGGLEPLARRASSVARLWRRAQHALRRRPLVAAGLATVVTATVLFLFWPESQERFIKGAFRLAEGARIPEVQELGRPVHPGDTLGVRLEVDSTAHVYALSVFGEDHEGRRLLPMLPERWVPEGLQAERSGHYDLRVPKGSSDVVCTVLGPDAQGQEGLMVIAAATPLASIEAWLAMLDGRSRDLGGMGVPYAEGMNFLESVIREGGERGLSPGELGESYSRRLAALEASQIPEPTSWKLEGIDVFQELYPVVDLISSPR